MSAILIGLAGYRQVGKSHIADHLVNHHGFSKVHPFNGGKAATRAYYVHLGIDEHTAWEMTDGSLKDTPCEQLPGGVSSRFFMEKFGKFMGVEMGPDWTIGKELELSLARGDSNQRLLVESIVYEDAIVRAQGGSIWKVERPTVLPTPGLKTDEYTSRLLADETILNDFATLDELYRHVDCFVEEHLGLRIADMAL